MTRAPLPARKAFCPDCARYVHADGCDGDCPQRARRRRAELVTLAAGALAGLAPVTDTEVAENLTVHGAARLAVALAVAVRARLDAEPAATVRP